MSDRDFEKFVFEAYASWALKVQQQAEEHCKQGEPVASIIFNEDEEYTCMPIGREVFKLAPNVEHKLFTHAMPKREDTNIAAMRNALEAVNGMFWVEKSTKHEIYESSHYPGKSKFTRESLGKHIFQLLRELDGEVFENNILFTPQPSTDVSELADFKGHKSLAEMVSTHIRNWRHALISEQGIYQRNGDDNNVDYIKHELSALDDIESAVTTMIAKHTVK